MKKISDDDYCSLLKIKEEFYAKNQKNIKMLFDGHEMMLFLKAKIFLKNALTQTTTTPTIHTF
jgi:hypothetical protein